MNPSEYDYESVQTYLLICPDIPINLSEQSYINVRKHRLPYYVSDSYASAYSYSLIIETFKSNS